MAAIEDDMDVVKYAVLSNLALPLGAFFNKVNGTDATSIVRVLRENRAFIPTSLLVLMTTT